MDRGNPNKVNAIVDEIVKNNNLFKLKSPIEQDKEKDSMAKSINSALSTLNEVGKELVLQDLSVDPDEKFKGFIDSAGNIDLSGLTKFTTTIVKAKIEEAEREGLDLTNNNTNMLKNNKTLVTEGILTVAVIDTMIKNYDKLSYGERTDIIKNWGKLSSVQRRTFLQKQYQSIENINGISQSQKNELQEGITTSYETECINGTKLTEDEQKSWYDEFVKVITELTPEEIPTEIQEQINRSIQQGKGNSGIYEDLNGIIIQYQQEISSFLEDLQEGKSKTDSDIKRHTIRTAVLKFYNKMKLRALDQSYENGAISEQSYKEAQKYYKNERDKLNKSNTTAYRNPETVRNLQSSIANTQEIYIRGPKRLPSDVIRTEIEQIPIALAEKFSQEAIREALKQYKLILEQLPEKYITKLDNASSEDRYEMLNIIFTKKGNMKPEISEILSKVNYDNQLINILKDETKRKNFFEQLGQVIEKTEQYLIKDEHVQEGINSGRVKEESLDASAAIKSQQYSQKENQHSEQEQPDIYSFLNSEYLQQDSVEGLIPRNGENSQAIQDDKKAIFYSQGKEGAIVMYFEFMRKYEALKGADGDVALQQYNDYQNGILKLSSEQVQLLQGQLKQISQIRGAQSFDEFMGDRFYLKLGGIDISADKQEADIWRQAHPGTKMNYNYANSWTTNTISPDRIDVVSLQSKDGTDVKISQKDIITYFLSQTSIEKIEELGVNNKTLAYIKNFYKEHSAEISQLGSEYSLATQNIKEFAQERQSQKPTIETHTNQQVIEQTEFKENDTSEHSTENLPIKQDDSFIGKIRRVIANMRDSKNKSGKGFFGRLKDSIQTEFGNKKDSQYFTQEDSQQQSSSHIAQEPQTFDDRYQVNLTPEQIVQATSSSKSQQSQTKIQNKQEDEKGDDESLNM